MMSMRVDCTTARLAFWAPRDSTACVFGLCVVRHVEVVEEEIYWVGQNHTFIGIHGVYTVFLAGVSPYIWSYTVCKNGSGQP